MADTVDDMATRIIAEMGRGDSATVVGQIISTIKHHEREGAYFAKRHLMRVEIVAGQQWYSVIGYREDGFSTAEEREAEGNINSEDLQWSFDDFPYTGRIERVLKIDYAGIEPATGAQQRSSVEVIEYEDFERMDGGRATSGQPCVATMHSQQIGVYPTPDKNYYLRLSGMVKPFIPSLGSHTSIWLYEAEELIRSGAKMRLCRDNYRDPDGVALYGAAERSELSRIRTEGVLRHSNKRIVATSF